MRAIKPRNTVSALIYATVELIGLTQKVNNELTLTPIGQISTPYQQKFAIPRQPGLVSSALGCITLTGTENHQEMVRGLSEFSHIWLLFIFHANKKQEWKPLVKPPRLGGNKKVGVLATRSTFRPNPLGMSVVKLEKVEVINNTVKIYVSGVDLLNQTPIVDIKPYIPYSDSLPNASASFAQTEPEQQFIITYSQDARQQLIDYQKEYPELMMLINQVLGQDPRPAYKKPVKDNNEYGMTLYTVNIRWRLVSFDTIEVFELSKVHT